MSKPLATKESTPLINISSEIFIVSNTNPGNVIAQNVWHFNIFLAINQYSHSPNKSPAWSGTDPEDQRRQKSTADRIRSDPCCRLWPRGHRSMDRWEKPAEETHANASLRGAHTHTHRDTHNTHTPHNTPTTHTTLHRTQIHTHTTPHTETHTHTHTHTTPHTDTHTHTETHTHRHTDTTHTHYTAWGWETLTLFRSEALIDEFQIWEQRSKIAPLTVNNKHCSDGKQRSYSTTSSPQQWQYIHHISCGFTDFCPLL